MRARRRVGVVTTSRADYGLLYWLLRSVSEDRSLELQLYVSGSHLAPRFGGSLDAIRQAGFPIAAKVDLALSGGTGVGTARSTARGVEGFARAFAARRPDVAVLLGDRFEILAAAAAALAMRVPVAHIHGGESSEGVIDEQVRHAVTKLSHLHFTAAEPYRRRVIQMGESPDRVYNLGAPGLEYIRRLRPLGRAALESRLGLSLEPPVLLATFHPVPEGLAPLDAMLSALDASGARCVLTHANADSGGRACNERIRHFAARRPGRAVAVESLGQDGYLSLLRLCAAAVGNSSSGIIEAPALRVPTVNIGDRQAGRLRAPSVIDCGSTATEIGGALRRALSPAFRRERCRGATPYGAGDFSARAVRVLRSVELGEALLRKRFAEPDRRLATARETLA